MTRRLDLLAAGGAVLAFGMLFVYVSVMRQQDDNPAAWVIAVLLAGGLAAGYGTVTSLPHRRAVLWSSGLLLMGLGLLAILTIGLPILLAGALCLVAGARTRPATASV